MIYQTLFYQFGNILCLKISGGGGKGTLPPPVASLVCMWVIESLEITLFEQSLLRFQNFSNFVFRFPRGLGLVKQWFLVLLSLGVFLSVLSNRWRNNKIFLF